MNRTENFGTSVVKITPSFSKWKTYKHLIAIITSLVGFAIAAVGLCGYFQVGNLSNMAQIETIAMMGIGGGSGIILLIIGIIQRRKINSLKAIDTEGGWKYGPDAWRIWDIEVLDEIPNIVAPPSNQDQVLLYIPYRIKHKGKEFILNLKFLTTILPFASFTKIAENEAVDLKSSRWVLIDKQMLAGTPGNRPQEQTVSVSNRLCRMPTVLEAVIFYQMIFAFTQNRLHENESVNYTRCTSEANGSFIVGNFTEIGLDVIRSSVSAQHIGVIATQTIV